MPQMHAARLPASFLSGLAEEVIQIQCIINSKIVCLVLLKNTFDLSRADMNARKTHYDDPTDLKGENINILYSVLK